MLQLDLCIGLMVSIIIFEDLELEKTRCYATYLQNHASFSDSVECVAVTDSLWQQF